MTGIQWLKRFILPALVVVVLVAGCSKTPSQTTTSAVTTTATTTSAPARTTTTTSAPATTVKPTTAPATTAAGPYGDLRVGLATFGSEQMNPVYADGGTVTTMLAPIYDILVDWGAKGLQPGLAEKWVMSSDAKSWTFTIRKGVKFHTGDDLTAEDVKFSLDAYGAKDAYASDFQRSFERSEIIDNYTVKIHTVAPQLDLPAFLTLVGTTGRGLILPKKYFEQKGKAAFNDQPVGTGAFQFVRRIPGDEISLEANTKYWGQVASFKKLTLLQMPEETTRVAALKTRGLDEIEISPDSAPELRAGGFKTIILGTPSSMVLLNGAYQPEGAKLPIANIKVRQALSLAINRDEIMKNFFHGDALPPGPPQLSDQVIGIDTTKWMNYAATKLNRYDPAEATRLIKEAGYPQGFDITLWTYTQAGAAYSPAMAQVIQGYWNKVGVNARVQPVDWGTFQRTRNTLRTPTPGLIGQAH
ncbi:MAG: ABC transporter substrate-binding protein, partial [Chloroflexi bacterium]|nr:ABC transporter substrate-binding protein [Chloroflexota bacterium]